MLMVAPWPSGKALIGVLCLSVLCSSILLQTLLYYCW